MRSFTVDLVRGEQWTLDSRELAAVTMRAWLNGFTRDLLTRTPGVSFSAVSVRGLAEGARLRGVEWCFEVRIHRGDGRMVAFLALGDDEAGVTSTAEREVQRLVGDPAEGGAW